MKKLLTKTMALVLSSVLVLSLAACGGSTPGTGESANQSQNSAANSSSQTQQNAGGENETGAGSTAPAETPDGQPAVGKTLVVYYSATNNTEAVAGYIAEATGGDMFELLPVEPYTSGDLDWTDRNSRVSKEHDDESLRAVELENAVPDNWEDYDTVFIGYPIWWGIAAWPVDGFISANDFTGKTVIPFCTSSSSGLGQSGELLADAAGTGTWLEGQRFQSHVSQETVLEWVDGLALG